MKGNKEKLLLSMMVLDKLQTNEKWVEWVRRNHKKLLEEIPVITVGHHHYIRVAHLNKAWSKMIPESVNYIVNELVAVYREEYGD